MQGWYYEDIKKSKYVLYFRTYNIEQFKLFNNIRALKNFIYGNNLSIYYYIQNY